MRVLLSGGAWLICLLLAGCTVPTPAGGPGSDAVSLEPFLEDVPRLTGLTWQTAAPMRSSAHSMACTFHEGEIWAVGGIDGRNLPTSSVQVYDPRSGSWRSEVYLPTLGSTGLHSATAVSIGDRIQVVGGYESIGRSKATDKVYELRTIFWTEATPLPYALAESEPVSFGDTPLLWGGTRDGRNGDDGVLRYIDNIEGWTPFITAPTARADGTAHFRERDGLYVLGGWTDGPNSPTTNATVYDFENGEQRNLKPIPAPRTGSASAAWDGKMYLVGGLFEGRTTADVLVLDVDTGTWWQAPALPVSTSHACALALEDGLHVFGGSREDGRGAIREHWILGRLGDDPVDRAP